MLDEVLYMQVRLFRLFLARTRLSSRDGNRVFNESGAWDFIASCYDSLHLGGDECALQDVLALIDHAGVALSSLR